MSDQESDISMREGEKLRHSKTWMHVDTKNQQWRKKLGFFMPSKVLVSQSMSEHLRKEPQNILSEDKHFLGGPGIFS